MRILVIGGAGYFGSHMFEVLADVGHHVVVLDNFSTGHRSSVRSAELITGDVRESARLDALLPAHRFEAVTHIAACSQVAESRRNPGRYYGDTVAGSSALLDALVRQNVSLLIFEKGALT